MRRKDAVAFINIIRKDGSDGTISCFVSTINEVDGVPGKKAAIADRDFVPISMKEIIFKSGEVEQRVEINMPDCDGDLTNTNEDDEADVVSFAL